MKVFGKRTLTIDCSWELVDDSKLRSKLKSFTDEQLVDYCFENGKFEEGHNHDPKFQIDYILTFLVEPEYEFLENKMGWDAEYQMHHVLAIFDEL